MQHSLSDLYQVVVLKNAFYQMHRTEVKNWFHQLLSLKCDGYAEKHSARFLPVNSYDFFAIHLLLCHKKSGTPIFCSKIVPYSSCVFFNLKFPLFELESDFKPHEWSELLSLIESRVHVGKDLSYSGGFTINPQDKGFGKSPLFKDLYTGLHYLAHLHFHLTSVFGFGAVKIGTADFFKTWGVTPLKTSQGEMSPIVVKYGNALESLLLWGDIENVSDYKKRMGTQFKDLWDQRVEYSQDFEEQYLLKKSA
jgi:hypothetical protein